MWLEDFERFEKKIINDSPRLTADIIIINLKDYKKFFQKMRKMFIFKEKLK